MFSEEAIGTTVPLNEYQANEDIEQHFVKISAKTNIYPKIETEIAKKGGDADDAPTEAGTTATDSGKRVQNETITEVRVPGNVTGILIPNTKRIVVRVLIPIIFENREFEQDLRYVQWKIVSI